MTVWSIPIIFILFLLFCLNNNIKSINANATSETKDNLVNLNKERLVFPNDNNSIDVSLKKNQSFISIYGVINSSFSTPNKDLWIAIGTWIIDLQNDNPVLDLNMTWHSNKDSLSQNYHIYNFEPTNKSIKSLNDIQLRGIIKMIINNKTEIQTPITIQIQNKTLALTYNEEKVNSHFGRQPLYGIVTAILTKKILNSIEDPLSDNQFIQKPIENKQQN